MTKYKTRTQTKFRTKTVKRTITKTFTAQVRRRLLERDELDVDAPLAQKPLAAGVADEPTLAELEARSEPEVSFDAGAEPGPLDDDLEAPEHALYKRHVCPSCPVSNPAPYPVPNGLNPKPNRFCCPSRKTVTKTRTKTVQKTRTKVITATKKTTTIVLPVRVRLYRLLLC